MDIKLKSLMKLKLQNTNFIDIRPILIDHIDIDKI